MRGKHAMIGFVIALGLNHLASAAPCSPIPPLPKDSPLQKQFISWLARSSRAHIVARPASRSLYEVDINNDGKKELIIASQEGALKLTSLDIYEQDPEFKFVGKDTIPIPQEFDQAELWHTHAYTGKKRPELFVKCKDTVAISFQGAFAGERELYVWLKDQSYRACSQEWVDFYLQETKEFIQQKNLFFAENNLGAFFKRCETRLSLPERTRVLKELVYIQAAIGDSNTCTHYSDMLRRSEVSEPQTEVVCRNLDPKANMAVFDEARSPYYDINEIISVTAPMVHDIEFKRVEENWIKYKPLVGIHGKRNFSFNLRGYLTAALRGKNFDKTMLTPRVVQFDGCKDPACEERAMIWLDVDQHQSMFAITGFKKTPLFQKENCLLIGSRTSAATSIPDPFWKVLKRFKTKHQIPETLPICMIYESEGRSVFTILSKQKAISHTVRGAQAHGPESSSSGSPLRPLGTSRGSPVPSEATPHSE